MTESKKDVLLAIALVALGLGTLFVLSRTPDNGTHAADVLDFATLPRIYALMLTALSGVLAVTAWLRGRQVHKWSAPEDRRRSALSEPRVLGRALGTIALTAIYIVAIEHLNFMVATTTFLALTFLLYGRRPLWGVALTAVLGAAALDVVFIRIIDLPLH